MTENELSLLNRIEFLQPGESITIDSATACWLRCGLPFRQHMGSPFWESHYRCPLPDGSGFHLKGSGQNWSVHRDQFDPSISIVSMYKHIRHEALVETLVSIAVVYLGFRGLSWLARQ